MGEVFRRLAAKAALAIFNQRISRLLSEQQQIGVGVSNGTYVITSTARRLAIQWSRSGKGFLKIDLSNAFNEVDRTAMLGAVA